MAAFTLFWTTNTATVTSGEKGNCEVERVAGAVLHFGSFFGDVCGGRLG